jgi:hypothetical protein
MAGIDGALQQKARQLAQQKAQQLAAKQWLLSLPPADFMATMQSLGADPANQWALMDEELTARRQQVAPPNLGPDGPWDPRRGGPRRATALAPEPAPAPSSGLSFGGGADYESAAAKQQAIDTAYEQAIRDLNFQQGEYGIDRDQAWGKLDADYAEAMPVYERSREQGGKRLAANYEGRGLLRSGSYLNAIDENTQNYQRNVNQQTTRRDTGKADAEAAYQQKLREIAQKRTQAELQYGKPVTGA